jgi:hypothetical protein
VPSRRAPWHLQVESIELNQPLGDARFVPPAAPAADFAITGGTSTVVPFELVNNQLHVQVTLNGQGPFRMVCDTGGVNLVSPEVAQRLGLEPEGTIQARGAGEASQDVSLVKVKSLQLGAATLENQLFVVFPLGGFTKISGAPFDGLVGYEVFKRFVVTLDYDRRQLELTQPSAFAYDGPGPVVPFEFKGRVPQVDGEIDGLEGKSTSDTGSRVSLDLLGPFVEKNGLRAKYAPTVEGVTGWGVGGPVRAQVTRATLLELGSVSIPAPVTMLSRQKAGVFADAYVAGNVGAGVLKRFRVIFDYQRQRLIFEPGAEVARRDVFDRAGLWLNLDEGAFEVADVIPGGPAADAGLASGDRILAVDGKPASSLSLPDLRLRFRSDPPGTGIHLRVRSGKAERDVELTLRDLV